MDYPLQVIRAYLSGEGNAELAFAILVGLVIMLVIAALGIILTGSSDPLRKRVRQLSAATQTAAPTSWLGRLFSGKKKNANSLKSHLLHAGIESESGPASYWAVRVLLMVLLPIAVFMIAPLITTARTDLVLLSAILASGIGYLIPGIYLDYKEKERMIELTNGFPDALDLLVACTEAGMGLNAALQRVGDQLVYSHPAVAHQFNLVNYEIRGGVDRMTALKNMTERTGLDSVRSLVGVLGQTMRYGTSVADTLRVFAEDLRDKRMQAAEEQAAKLGTKMIFPLIFCLFPSFFLVAIGPAIVGALAAFK